jgi:hypothetical protein
MPKYVGILVAILDKKYQTETGAKSSLESGLMMFSSDPGFILMV